MNILRNSIKLEMVFAYDNTFLNIINNLLPLNTATLFISPFPSATVASSPYFRR